MIGRIVVRLHWPIHAVLLSHSHELCANRIAQRLRQHQRQRRTMLKTCCITMGASFQLLDCTTTSLDWIPYVTFTRCCLVWRSASPPVCIVRDATLPLHTLVLIQVRL